MAQLDAREKPVHDRYAIAHGVATLAMELADKAQSCLLAKLVGTQRLSLKTEFEAGVKLASSDDTNAHAAELTHATEQCMNTLRTL